MDVTRHNIGQLGDGGPFWGGVSRPTGDEDLVLIARGSEAGGAISPLTKLVLSIQRARARRRHRDARG